MKILFVDNFPAPYRVDFFNLLAEQCELTVIYGVKNDKTRNVRWQNEDMRYSVYFTGGLRLGNTGNISWRFKKIIGKGNFDCIVMGGYSSPMQILCMRYLRRKGIPFILNADGGFIMHNESAFKRRIKKSIISSARAWITTSVDSINYLTYYGARKQDIFLYPFAFNHMEELRLYTMREKEVFRSELAIPYKYVVISVSRFLELKRIPVLIMAAKELSKDIGVYIIGDKPTPEFIALKNEHDLSNVHFVDFLSKKDLSKYYAVANVFVLPTSLEVWGLVINEAMFHGLPVITTDMCNAGSELVKDGENGFIVPVDSVAALSNAIRLILENPVLELQMAQNSYERMKEFHIANNVCRHMEIFEDFCRKNTTKRVEV